MGSRMMTQLVSDLTDQCGPKAIEAGGYCKERLECTTEHD